MNLDIGKAFTYVTDDPKWVTKLLIGGGLCLLFPIAWLTIVGGIAVGLILSGYFIQTVRNVISGAQYPLPEWDNWGERMIDGLKAWLIGFVYALPAAIISLAFSLPSIIAVISDSASGNTSSSGVFAATQGLSSLGSCLAWIVGILTSFFVTVALGRYAATSDLGQAFQIGPIFAKIRQHFVTYLVIGLISSILLGLISALGLIAFCIGAAFTIFYCQVVQAHLFGQAHRQAEGQSQPAYGMPYGNDPYGNQRPF